MTDMSRPSRRAFTFTEVLIALLVVLACGVPIFYMVTSTRTDTSKAINYLRAMELANEAIEWANASEFSKLESMLPNTGGTLVTQSGSGFQAEKVALVAPANAQWTSDGLVANDIRYSEQYNNAFFFRTIEVTPDPVASVKAGSMVKVTVTVEWCEGRKPANPSVRADRMRSIQLETFVLNERDVAY